MVKLVSLDMLSLLTNHSQLLLSEFPDLPRLIIEVFLTIQQALIASEQHCFSLLDCSVQLCFVLHYTAVQSFISFIHSFRIFIQRPFKKPTQRRSQSSYGQREMSQKLAERRHVVLRQQAECKREFIPSGGANNRESSTLLKRRAGPRNQELTTSSSGKIRLRLSEKIRLTDYIIVLKP